MIRVISPISPVGFDSLHAVAISILVEWGIVVGSSMLVAVFAVAISILVVRGAPWIVLLSYWCLLWLP